MLFLALALDGFLRFVFLGQTHGGFQAGLTIGIAGLCDPTAVIFAFGFAAAAPLIAPQSLPRATARRTRNRGRAVVSDRRRNRRVDISVLALHRQSALGWLRTAAPGLWSDGGTWGSLSTALTQSVKPVLLTPIFLLVSAPGGHSGAAWAPAYACRWSAS